ncbi:MAG: RagB/SusD family nutrient uptake outer membrane protein [Bacteroidaceae bacterium]|nr:RagB/SusD family nutrient uptake outer membrane protein [Bacteroidaceae bacterium]
MRKVSVLSLALATFGSSLLTLGSCSEPESNLVDFNHTLNSPNDTVYSLLGVIHSMRKVADRTVILGEVRGDLVTVTDAASYDLKNLAGFKNLGNNEYNKISDYYAIIQNCNFFIENANLSLKKHGEYIFRKEYAVIKSYRAWAYLQLAINYGSVPFFTKTILSEKEADVNAYPKYDVQQIAEYFINDIKDNVDIEYPSYGSMGTFTNSRDFYLNVRVLLGDLCLWAGRYAEAAKYYHDYLTKLGDTHPTGVAKAYWSDRDFSSPITASYINDLNLRSENITVIPMETTEYDGLITKLYDAFCSTTNNNYFYALDASESYTSLSKAQRSILVDIDPVTQLPDTLVYEHINGHPEIVRGDLREYGVFNRATLLSSNDGYSKDYLTNYKYRTTSDAFVRLYRTQHVYLRYAEALNRAGYPNAAFAILKYGLWRDNIANYIPEHEREVAGDLLSFSEYSFTEENTQGIHSRGCNRADADTLYKIPECATKADSILAVENLICDEMALETVAEGLRYYDLMRISMHRNDPTFLADKIARRNGTFDQKLFNYLKDQKNWYLPIK